MTTGRPHDQAPEALPFDVPITGPDVLGRFGPFGGRFVPETLMNALNQLTLAYEEARSDPEFQQRLNDYLKDYVGRPSPLFHAQRLTRFAGGAEIYLKREDLNHTGAHKINNAIGQVMLAERMKQETRDCRDGGRPARRGHRDGVRPLRNRVHGLHG